MGLLRPLKERIPNGRLVLAIHNAPHSERLTCGDTKRQAIETRLEALVVLLEGTSSAIKAPAVEAALQAEEHRRWQEEQRKAEERQRREKALVEDVERRLDPWIAAGRYRQLADAVEAMPSATAEDDRWTRWVAWLRSYATRVEDEVVRKLPDPEKGPEPSWRY